MANFSKVPSKVLVQELCYLRLKDTKHINVIPQVFILVIVNVPAATNKAATFSVYLILRFNLW